jgi:hypothetical protein
MVTMQPEVFDGGWLQPLDGQRHAVLLDDPGQIAVGDWLRDLGTLRQVRVVERLPDVIGCGVTLVVRFVSQPGVPDWTLGISSRTKVTVWRELGASWWAPPPGVRLPGGPAGVLITQVRWREMESEAMSTLMEREEVQGVTLDEVWLEGRQDDGDQDSGGKHGGGGDDTNDNKDDGHIPPGDKK